MKFNNTLTQCVIKDLENNNVPMLLGEPGIGKSSWLGDLATRLNTKCFTLACNQLADKADLTGARLVPVLDKDGNASSYKQMFFPHAVIHDAIEYAKANPRETPILFLDELNRTTSDITSEALSIPTMRSIGGSKLPQNLRVVIAGNDKGNITSLDEASISRFCLYHVTPDTNTFLSLDDNLNPFVKNVLTNDPSLIFGKKKSESADGDDDEFGALSDLLSDNDMEQITTPRTIMAVSRWLNSHTNEELKALIAEISTVDGQDVSALQEVIIGHIGKTKFADALINEIIENISTIDNQANNITPAKPEVYDRLHEADTIDALEAIIAKLSKQEATEVLIYALFDKQDNANIINMLCEYLPKLDNEDVIKLLDLHSQGMLDEQNLNILFKCNTDMSYCLSILLGH